MMVLLTNNGVKLNTLNTIKYKKNGKINDIKDY